MGNIKRLIIDLWKLLTWDWPVLLLFEVIYKMVFLTVMSLSKNGIDFALTKAGIEYLTNQNLFQVLANPYSMAALVLSFLSVIYVSFLEITAIILYCHMGLKGEKISVYGLLTESAKGAGRLFWPGNLWVFLLFVLAMPVTGISVMSGPIGSLRIPGFILEFIRGNTVLSILYGGLMFVLIFLFFRWIFGLHEFVLNRLTFRRACQKSAELVNGKKKCRFCTVYHALSMDRGVAGLYSCPDRNDDHHPFYRES